jgi:hypothetical protein
MKLRDRIVAAGWVALTLSTAVSAHAQETVDQENLPSGTVQYVSCGVGPGSISQGFTPALSPLTAVEIMLYLLAPPPPASSRTVRIRSGAVDGPIVGETSAENQTGWTRYDFAGGVVVVPGQLYVIEVAYSAQGEYVAQNSADTYPGGHGYGCTNNPNPNVDVVFRTYANTTLPTREVTWGRVKTLYRD